MVRTTRKLLALVLTLAMLMSLFALTATASERKVIVITPNSDINPFIRFFAKKDTFNTGGPFTVRFDIKIENYKRMSQEGNVFIDLYNMDGVTTQIVWKGNTNGWVDAKKEDGSYITFDNVNGALIDGVIQEYYLINLGGYFASGKISIRNFRILDSAGKVRYSFDTDPDLAGISNLRDITSEEPCILPITFGDGTGTFVIETDSGSDTNDPKPTEEPSGPIFEDETPEPTSKPTTSPSQTEKPAETEEPKDTDAPVFEDPDDTEEPVFEDPDDEEDPNNEEDPNETEDPDETAEPIETEDPHETEEPVEVPGDEDTDDKDQDGQGKGKVWILAIVGLLILAAGISAYIFRDKLSDLIKTISAKFSKHE